MFDVLDHDIACIDTGYVRPGLACCYLVSDGAEAAIIETGTAPGVPMVLAAMAACGVAPEQVRYIIPTHVHLDHAGGAGTLLQHCPHATLLVHPLGARHLIDPARLVAGAQTVYGEERFAALYGEIVPAPAERVREAADGSRWQLGRRELLMRDTPGHARHHFCVWDERSRGWFSGDTFGIAYRELYCAGAPFLLPATTPVQFDPEALLASLELLMDQDPASFYLTHFGRIDASARDADSMREQIADYVRIAATIAGGDDEQARLTEALTVYTLSRLREAGCSRSGEELRALLAMDMDLNAQGLISWRGRRA